MVKPVSGNGSNTSNTNDIFIIEPQFTRSDIQAEFFTTATILNEKA